MSFKSPFAGLSRVVLWLSVMRLIGALGFSISIPFLSLYLHEELNISMSLIGAMLTAAGVLGSVSASFFGALSDRVGRRGMLIGLLALRGASFLWLAWLVRADSPFSIFAAVFVFSSMLGTSIFPLTEAIVSDVTPLERRADAFGALRVTMNLGWGVGPAIGGTLAVFGYHWLFVATALAVGGAALLVALTIHETNAPTGERHRAPMLKPVLTDQRLMLFMGVGLMMFLARGQLISTLSVHCSGNVGLSKAQIGLLYGLNGLMVAALQIPTTKWFNRIAPLTALTWAALLYGLGYFLVGFAGTMTDLVVAMLIITTAEMIEIPTAATYVTSLAPDGMVGAYLGAFHFAFHLGWTVGPMVGGVLLDTTPHPTYAWTGVAIMAVLGGVGFKMLERIKDKG